MKVFIVTYQPYRYGTESAAETEIKYLLTENWEIKGTFYSNRAAKDYITKELAKFKRENEDCSQEFIDEEKDSYSIKPCIVRGPRK